MSGNIRKHLIYTLAIMLVLIPFTSVYSVAAQMGDMHVEMQPDCHMVGCEHAGHAMDGQQSAQVMNHDSGCDDRCDASFGSQVCLTETTTSAGLAPDRVFNAFIPLALPDPLIFSFLRPPLEIS